MMAFDLNYTYLLPLPHQYVKAVDMKATSSRWDIMPS